MIHGAKFQNFKAPKNVSVDFDSRLTVLVGPNGSGKTSLLQGIDVVCRSASSNAAAPGFNGGPGFGHHSEDKTTLKCWS